MVLVAGTLRSQTGGSPGGCTRCKTSTLPRSSRCGTDRLSFSSSPLWYVCLSVHLHTRFRTCRSPSRFFPLDVVRAWHFRLSRASRTRKAFRQPQPREGSRNWCTSGMTRCFMPCVSRAIEAASHPFKCETSLARIMVNTFVSRPLVQQTCVYKCCCHPTVLPNDTVRVAG